MERTVPTTESEEIELYTRTYYSLLRTTAEVQIHSLEEAHTSMRSLMHGGARDPVPDMSAFIYSLLRLPACIADVDVVVLGQSGEVFARGGYPDVFKWQEVTAIARRRRCFYNGKDVLACLIASRSDIDDIVPVMTAYQIEWNKLHLRLQRVPQSVSFDELCNGMAGCNRLAEMLEIPVEDLDRLYAIWDDEMGAYLERIANAPRDLRIQLLSGSLSEYRRATRAWWENIENSVPSMHERPVYFISSNTHSVINLVTGLALQRADGLVDFLKESGSAGLLHEWQDILANKVPSSRENFLYYAFKKLIQAPGGHKEEREQARYERDHGILRIPSKRYFDVETQVFELARLDPQHFDPRLHIEGLGGDDFLRRSDALILNIDYPLGLAAYNLLSEITDNVGAILGVYVLGKAATLNGVIGDAMIPNVVHDEHSQNTYLFPNNFSAGDMTPYQRYGSVLDNQKAVTVQGTFLQNTRYMDVFYREGYTDIEMEAGPYLSAVYEMYRPKRHPVNEIVNLYGIPFDLGIIHYASDTPLSKGKNLGAGSLSYYGMDSTYAGTIAVLRRIICQESKRLGSGK
jgi:Family of unknown function (DUF6909)